MHNEHDYLIQNISLLVASGMPILEAVDTLAGGVRSRRMKKKLATLKEQVAAGEPLWKAFKHIRLLSPQAISLIRLGEESGKLSENLKLIAVQEEKDRALRSKIRSAMIYPSFVLTLTVIVGVSIAWFILPRLASVFAQLRVELPILTQWLIASGTYLEDHGVVVLPIALGVFLASVYIIFYFPYTRFIGQAILFSLPGIRHLLQEIELSRFGYMLGSLLGAGMPVTEALDSLSRATGFARYRRFYRYLRDSIAEGNSFQKSFTKYRRSGRFIPIPIQQLIAAGERSGTLPETLQNINTTFEARTENTTKNLTTILEPILLVIVWLGVVAVALAVILPIYSLTGGINREVGSTPGTAPRVSTQSAEETSTAAEDNETQTYTLVVRSDGTGYVNIREQPATTEVVVGQAVDGSTYEYVGERDGWYEIVLSDNSRGWIFSDYVSFASTTTQ